MSLIPNDVISRLTQLSCEDVATKLNIVVKKHKALCFMHEDHHPSLAFLGSNRTSWFCFVCNKGGNAIDLVCEYTNCSFIEACLWLCDKYSINIGDSVPVVRKLNIKTQKTPVVHSENKQYAFSKEVGQYLIEAYGLADIAKSFLFEERKLSPQVIDELNISSLDNGRDVVCKLKRKFDEQTLIESGFVSIANGKTYLRLFTPCLLFPYYNKKKELVGLQSRYLGDNEEAPRFQFISTQKTRLYNMPIMNELKPNEELYISEGITDCLALLSSGKKAVAIPSATIFPEYDLNALSEYRLVMVPDNDDAGKKAFGKLQQFFIDRFCFLKEEKLPEGVKDYSEYYRTLYADK